MKSLADNPDQNAPGPLTEYGQRFEAAVSSARAFIHLQHDGGGGVVGIGEVLEHLDEVFGKDIGLTSDVGIVLNLITALWEDPHIDQVPGGWVDFCWNPAGDWPREDGQGLVARLRDRLNRERPRGAGDGEPASQPERKRPMSNADENDPKQDGDTWLFDMDGHVVEVSSSGGAIRLFAWKITEDSYGRPYQTSADSLELTPRKAIELARRLLLAATE